MKKEFGRAISIILASAVAITSFYGLPAGKLHTQAASVKVKSPRIAEDGTVTWDKVTFGTYPPGP
ncbi:MAG: hypothetical protein K6C95_08620 [Lachnospiraceae bacterium]|nr:hypothetical protein [Lachnospiraceae bacterium]